MKKIALFLVAAMASLSLRAQVSTISTEYGVNVYRTPFHNAVRVHHVEAKGRCLVSVVRSADTSQYIEYYTIGGEPTEQLITFDDRNNLSIYHSGPAIFRVHIAADLHDLTVSAGKGSKVTVDSDSQKAIDELISMAENGAPDLLLKVLTKLMIASDNISVSDGGDDKNGGDDSDDGENGGSNDGGGTGAGTKQYDRGHFDFHWGFNNWGSSPFSGLVGMSEAGYDLRTSFSSYQISYRYSFVMGAHLDLSLGLGYESDVYKFNRPYIDYADGDFYERNAAPSNGYYSTRFVTRYVQLPVALGWRSKANGNGLNLRLSAIPALGWCGKHTGLKHELHKEGSNEQDQANLKDFINPYKLDVRLDIDFGGIGVFLQVAALPLFVDTVKIYPIKLGFAI